MRNLTKESVMAMIVRAFPVLPGKENELLEFAKAVGDSRRQETASFLQSFGLRRESWHVQRTPHGMFVIVVTDVEDPPIEKARAYSVAQGSFERWFKDQVKALSGIDPDAEPLGPPTETVFAWDSGHNRRRTFDAPTASA
jgi:hypothetical protein